VQTVISCAYITVFSFISHQMHKLNSSRNYHLSRPYNAPSQALGAGRSHEEEEEEDFA